MNEMESRPIHVQHVTRLALQLFDGLTSLHGLDERERLLLEAAGLLHDIGHQFDYLGTGHHKESARMIRQRPWKNFTPPEVEVIAQVARYHRKGMPELEHEEFRSLGEWERRMVQRLAALLRIADSLDRTHEQFVQSVAVEVEANRIILRLEAAGPILREVKSAAAKGDLAVALFQRDLVFMVGDEEIKPTETPQ
jgi:exopolyphosphatase/guanosine-5'-triphosphate,3'-diphosphate pyrophosphatase